MARLTNPVTGSVVRCEGDLAAYYLAHGWADADAEAQVEATPEKPKTTTARRKRS